ncbi:acyltransferase [Acetanaerobacterium elongatum]|uniref:Surface polysaccharide O-acyltransferase, integral membrane enzyme n=1 Tax=Acetanaerobacterium elongatum TaxID=258515 RepID=A0A1H0CW89_9FIRM|nr:acyltransferase family protein [Acetanaerobacterium elongatum]SDN62135.1 Surface polysaccharide O-acyltransferase, integral membrane enzyme [Acetanaerobacterium elongatum]
MSDNLTIPGRIIYLDIVRILAIFAVVVIHIAACDWVCLPVSSFEWQTLNFYDAICRWCIPVFFMMSGRHFLHPEKTITFSTLFRKNVLRMVAALFFWGVLYYLYSSILQNGRIVLQDVLGGLLSVVTLKARRHLWFLYAITALYLMTPLLRRLVAVSTPKRLLRMSLGLIFVSGIIPIAAYFTPLRDMAFFLQGIGFPGLFILGYYISRYNTKVKYIGLLYAGGVLGLIFTIVASSILSVSENIGNQLFYQFTTPNVALTAIAMMVFGKNNLSKLSFGEKWDKRIEAFSNITFAMYLVHDFFIIPFERRLYGFTPTSLNPVFLVPLLAAAVFALSILPAYLFKKIPVLRNFIA